jgi:hypothetical protein
MVGGRDIEETDKGPDTAKCFDPTCNTTQTDWTKVYDLGTQKHPGDANQDSADDDPNNQLSAVDIRGDNAYAAYCGFCDTITQGTPFANGIATNVGGKQKPKKMTAQGWHIAKAKGLPVRYITSIQMDPNDPFTVFVTLAGYARRWVPPGATSEDISKIGKGHVFVSHDAGETFTDVSGNLPDVPANFAIVRNDQLVVATDIGVFIAEGTDGGRYEQLGTGLPAAPVLSLELKPGDPNTMIVASYGRGVYQYGFKDPAGLAAGGGAGGGGAGGSGACAASSGFSRTSVSPRGRNLRIDFGRNVPRPVRIDVFQTSRGRRVLGNRLIARFRGRTQAFSWNGKGTSGRRPARDGILYARYSIPVGSGVFDGRRVTFQRRKGRWHRRPSFYRRASCGTLSSYKLDLPTFGGTRRRSLGISYRLNSAARVSLTVKRGKRVVKRYKAASRKPKTTYRLRLRARGLAAGDYKVTISVVRGKSTVRSTLVSRRL